MNTEQPNQNVITPEKMQQVIFAFARLRELGSTVIIDPKNEAEVVGLKKFLGDFFLEHGNELVGCWVAVRQEYEPLVQTIERIANRVLTVRNSNRPPAQQAQ